MHTRGYICSVFHHLFSGSQVSCNEKPCYFFPGLVIIFFQDRDKASEALLSFSNLLRNLFRKMSEDMVPLEQELQQVRDYISLVTMGSDLSGYPDGLSEAE